MPNNLVVSHVVPRIISESSGISYCVPKLGESIALHGAEVHLHLLMPTILPSQPAYHVHTYPVVSLPFAFRFGLSRQLRQGLEVAASASHIMHNHSLWMLPNVYSGIVVRNKPCKLVISPHGTLAPWALQRSKIKKSIIMLIGQNKALQRASLFHATSEMEYEEIRAFGLRAPVTIIPNGIDIPELPVQHKVKHTHRLLFLSRIHPKKCVDMLIRCWRNLQDEFPNWQFDIAGPIDSSYAVAMQTLSEAMECKRICFTGALEGSAKSQAFCNADLFVLPTHSENFGLAVAEALAHGVPVIVSKNAPWKGVEDNKCGWWIDNNEDAFTAYLRIAMSMPAEKLSEMGLRGRQWMQRSFGWETIGKKMLAAYQWILGRGEKPDFVIR